MTKESVLGAAGILSDWAVWACAAPARDVAPDQGPRQAPRTDEETEAYALKARYQLLERENELLRQRLAIADKQVEVKDAQISDFKAITENLARQNQVLLMLAQGVPMERILKGGRHEIEVNATGKRAHVSPASERGLSDSPSRARIASRLRELVKRGVTHREIADILNEEGLPTLSGAGKWDRRKVGKCIRSTASHSPDHESR